MTDLEPERRFTKSPVESRPPRIAGFAAKYGTFSRDLGGWVETIAPSAFRKSQNDGWPDVIARYNHDNGWLLGSIAGKTLVLTTDKIGLHYEVTPPSSRADVVELVERGDISRSSFAFWSVRDAGDEWSLAESGMPLRTLVSVRLVDVSPVTLPAYVDTTAAIRSLAVHKDASVKEVRAMAAEGALRKLFVRSDAPARTPSQAASYLASRRRDPWLK